MVVLRRGVRALLGVVGVGAPLLKVPEQRADKPASLAPCPLPIPPCVLGYLAHEQIPPPGILQ